MNVWKLLSAESLEKTEIPNPTARDGLLRVRITKLLVNGNDAALFLGKTRVHYPVIPGRFAVGVIADETEHPLFPKGTRVLLRSYRHAEPEGTARRTFAEEETLLCGFNCDGFLRDFVLVSPDEVTPLPASVSDEQALVVHSVALAKAALDRLGAGKGQHIAVFGANLYGILLCQLLIYQQAAPLLIDSEEDRLSFARGCGVYYTLSADGNLLESVGEITGGRLASGAVYMTTRGIERDLPFLVSARGSNVVLCGPATDETEFDLELALKKQLSIRCVWSGADYVETAINFIANHAVDLSPFRFVPVKADEVKELLLSYKDDLDRDSDELYVLNLV